MEVQEALWTARLKWYNIGLRLKLGVSALEEIDAVGMSVGDKFRLVLKSWLQKTGPCTWRDLYDAITHPSVGLDHVANNLVATIPAGEL